MNNYKFKILILFIIHYSLIINNSVYSQYRYKYRIQLKDKKNSQYNITKPSDFLSDKSIKRRLTHKINLDEIDLPVNPLYLDSIRKTGVRVLNNSRWFNYVTIDTINIDSAILKKIKEFSFVSYIETIAKIPVTNKSSTIKLIPEKKFNLELNNLYSSNNIYRGNYRTMQSNTFISDDFYKYGNSYEQVNMIACNYLHNLGYKGKGLSIAVLDGGFIGVDKLPVFDSLRINNRIKGTKDFVFPGGSVYTAANHGMYVLSILAGNIPAIYLGTAPDADFWLLRTEDVKSENIIEEDNWVSAAEFADSVGVDLINSSLGYTRFDDASKNHIYQDLNGKTARISKAATMAAKKGILVVSSAGNEGADASWVHISVPADADSILAVGAVNNEGKYAAFSSQGPAYDNRIKPDVAALGLGSAFATNTGDISFGNGTSFSAPVIAGMAACLWQTKPDVSNMKIIDVIKKSSNHYNIPDAYTGYGIPNAAAAYNILNGKSLYHESLKSIIVSPNPFSNKVSIIIISPDTNDVNLELFDVTGKKVYSKGNIKKNNEYKYLLIDNVEELPNGIYLLIIYANGKISSGKLMKIK